MTINYLVSRQTRKPHAKKVTETKKGRMMIVGDWLSDETHAEIRRFIREANPGWVIAAYCQYPKDLTVFENTILVN